MANRIEPKHYSHIKLLFTLVRKTMWKQHLENADN